MLTVDQVKIKGVEQEREKRRKLEESKHSYRQESDDYLRGYMDGSWDNCDY